MPAGVDYQELSDEEIEEILSKCSDESDGDYIVSDDEVDYEFSDGCDNERSN